MTKIYDIAAKVIDIEIEGLAAIKEKLDDNFEKLIHLIQNSKGRVILSGMGKSGHIANKIAATLASTGTPAFTIHPGEASHGDLGMITEKDVVILLSNSGETKELSDIINYCKRFKISLVGLVRRKTSILVEAADIAIILPEIPEASSVNAPTTSTTMMLAFGDAIAVTLAELNGFTKEGFNKFHPGGKLGSAFIQTHKIMRSGKDLPIVKESDKMSDIIIEISNKSLGCAIVTDSKNQVSGIITDGDLRRHMSDNLLSQTAKEIMSKNPILISQNSLALEAVNIMQDKKITSIFVQENQQPIGVIHIHDCFKAGIL
jgi:arabinose-5-phosphate isomerase